MPKKIPLSFKSNACTAHNFSSKMCKVMVDKTLLHQVYTKICHLKNFSPSFTLFQIPWVT